MCLKMKAFRNRNSQSRANCRRRGRACTFDECFASHVRGTARLPSLKRDPAENQNERNADARESSQGHGTAGRDYFTSFRGMTSARGSGPNSSPNLIGGRSWNMKSHFQRSEGFDACIHVLADTGRLNLTADNVA